MNDTDKRTALELEFDVFAHRAQLNVPDDQRTQLLEDFKELHQMLRVIRTGCTADQAPDESFDLASVIRTL